VSPTALAELQRRLGPALYASSHWLWTESLRLLAISALEAGAPAPTTRVNARPAEWMLRLGGGELAA
jgi:hypothetical protein